MTPGWSRAICPEDTPRIATWLWPGPRFCTVKPATFAATSSMSVAPRTRSVSSLVADKEKGTFLTTSSRFMAVTVISSERFVSRVKSTVSVPPAATAWLCCSTVRKPKCAAETL